MFVTFEGPEGSGKSTQVALLAERLRRDGLTVVTTREPGGSPLGEALRAILLDPATSIGPETEAYLMTGARAEHVRRVIRPALLDGAVVLCDRFSDSTLAYQGAGRGLPIDALRAIQTLAVSGTWPDLTILVDVPAEIGLQRRNRAGDGNRIDGESVQFHERVAFWYRQEAREHPDRWIVIDGQRSREDVRASIYDAVTARLRQPGAAPAARHF